MEQRNSRKRLNSLILLVAFTAVMLIVSTYAWFSTQKNVTLGGLQGTVNVAEGLQISLDALNWKNEIGLDADSITEYFAQTNEKYGLTGNLAFSLDKPYPEVMNDASTGPDDLVTTYHKNIIPGEFLPASTIGRDAIGQTEMKLYRGNLTNGITLDTIHEINTTNDPEELGYYAIDFFLQNASSTAAINGGINDWLQLEKNSAIKLNETSKASTGLQNTIRVAFVLYDNQGGAANDVLVSQTPGQMQIINGTLGEEILDVAIWEPNASGTGFKTESGSQVATTGFPAHVDYVVQNNNTITFSAGDATTYGAGLTTLAGGGHRFQSQALLPTYALTATSDTKNDIADIYNWNITATDLIDTTTGLGRQYTLATTTDGVTDTTQLVSAEDGTTKFVLAPGEYHRMTMFVWLEGQDVDTINWASMGGDVTIDVGLSKPGTANQPS
jgi:hypothetical protein